MDIRCGTCGRKLGEGVFEILRIKCPRCKTINFLSASSALSVHHECHFRSDVRESVQEWNDSSA